MNRSVIAVAISGVVIVGILLGTYLAFSALAAHLGAGRILGLISAALMIGSGLACAGVIAATKKWIERRHGESE